MILSLYGQARLFFLTILIGGCLGLAYDGIRLFRRSVSHKRLWIQMEDGLFWLFGVFCVFRVMLRASSGEIRFFSILGLFGGMGLYFLSLSRLVIPIGERVLRCGKLFLCVLLRIIWTPFRLLFQLFGYPLRKIGNFCEKKRKKLLQSWKLYVKIKTQHFRKDWRILHRQKSGRGREHGKD